jgi:hypothetical protein
MWHIFDHYLKEFDELGSLRSPISCGLARPRSLVGEKPIQVAVSHGPGIQPCRCSGNRMLDA